MDSSWTVKRVLDWIEHHLAEHGCANAPFSAQWLVADALSCSRIELFVNLDRVLSEDERAVLRGYTKRRAEGEPLQYITGKAPFRFLTLCVSPGVLIPRPETEVLVSEAVSALYASSKDSVLQAEEPDADLLESAQLVELDGDGLYVQLDTGETIPVALDNDSDIVLRSVLEVKKPSYLVVDLCTGSGNIACSIASEVETAHVFATDISPDACMLAQRNIDQLGLGERVVVVQSDLGDLFPVEQRGTVDLVISNPPYIPHDELALLDAEVADFEPSLALDGGADGLAVFRRILPFAQSALRPGGVLALELHETCLDKAAAEAQACGFENVRIVDDLAGKPRVLLAAKA